MTQEEKARAYDEALERAKEQIKECGDNEGRKKMIRNIFPELHESEDEKTRKALIQFLNDIKNISESGRTSWAIRKDDAEMCSGFITYLEKQKERGPLTKEEEYTLQRIIEYLEDETCPPEWISLLHDIYCLPYEKQKEQKTQVFCEAKAYDLGYKQGKEDAIKEQKPAEWSEEDESELTAIIYFVSQAIKASNDENERNSLLSAKKWLQDKLSFRVKSLRPSWKPSEEQMKALEIAFRKDGDDKYRSTINSLYNDLKKL